MEQGVREAGHGHPGELRCEHGPVKAVAQRTWPCSTGWRRWTVAAMSLSGRNSYPEYVDSVLSEFHPLSSSLLSMNGSVSASPLRENAKAHGSPSSSTSKIRGRRSGKSPPNSHGWRQRHGWRLHLAPGPASLPSHHSVSPQVSAEGWQGEGTSAALPRRGPQKKNRV